MIILNRKDSERVRHFKTEPFKKFSFLGILSRIKKLCKRCKIGLSCRFAAGSSEKNIYSRSSHAAPFKDYISVFFGALSDYFIPKRKDRPSVILYKTAFFAVLIAFISSACFFTLYFYDDDKQALITQNAKAIWYSNEGNNFETLIGQNPDFSGWLKINNTLIDLPFYQTDNDEFYLNHNSFGEESRHGAVFLSSRDSTSASSEDKNLVLYGHNMPDGSMFGTLNKLRKLEFWKENPTVFLTSEEGSYTYVIYSVFLLNSNPAHDNGYIYHAQKSYFTYEDEFKAWVEEAKDRSLITTGIDVEFGDDILTLITEADDFEGARLVVMARRIRSGESHIINTSQASINTSALYPQKWYDDRNLEAPQ